MAEPAAAVAAAGVKSDDPVAPAGNGKEGASMAGMDAALAALEAKLSALKPSQIRKRAASSDAITDDNLDAAMDAGDMKAALIEMLVGAVRMLSRSVRLHCLHEIILVMIPPLDRASARSQERAALEKAAKTKASESKFKKMAIRSASAVVMFAVFAATLYSGHGWVCLLAVFIQAEIFREMVNVRYPKVRHSAGRPALSWPAI